MFPNYFRNPRSCWSQIGPINIINPKQNDRNFADDIFKCISFHEMCCILFQISLNFVTKYASNEKPSLIQKMTWHRADNNSLF